MTSSTNFAYFSPYTPPPDDRSYSSSLPTDASPSHVPETSYQSGGVPAFSAFSFRHGTLPASQEQQNPWETRYGLRVDVLAAIAYILGPVSALTLLVLETRNDYVRFHAYQSALLTTPLIFLRIFVSLVQSSPWMQTFFTLLLILPQGFMVIRAYLDASQHGLVHFHLPLTGFLAERWLAEE
ncbi:hypothetical protein L208DRAFT_1388787 [Tricholoma matsutake]|nr:hypothetical protein L208DRAFT_1388787 [Tricholoma matsutake 945]